MTTAELDDLLCLAINAIRAQINARDQMDLDAAIRKRKLLLKKIVETGLIKVSDV